MERKTFFGLVIGALLGLVLLFLIYMFFLQGTGSGNNIKNSIGTFFPIGDNTNTGANNNGEDEPVVGGENYIPGQKVIPILRRVSLAPASGFITYDRATTTHTTIGTSTTIKISTTTEMIVRYMEKSTGHIYESSEHTFDVPRISNTTLGIYDQATFSNPQSFVARKYNQDSALIDTYIGSLVRVGTTTDELKTVGSTFPRNPDVMAVRGTSIFSLYSYPLNSEGYVTQTTPVREVKVFSSPLSRWNVEWINKDLLLLTTAPNSEHDGYVYSFNPTTKSMRELFGPKSGLTAKVNSNLTAGIYSESYNNQLFTYISNLTKKTFFQLSSPTLPEKCVFSAKRPMIVYCAVPRPLPSGSYPEDWYKGKVAFQDAIVEIDIEKNIEIPLIDLYEESGFFIDATYLSLNEKESFIVFQNKRDGYVWSYYIGN